MSNDPEMQLPEGRTCADCVFVRNCCHMFGVKPENTWCDFHPVKFIASNQPTIIALTKTNSDLLAALKDLKEQAGKLPATQGEGWGRMVASLCEAEVVIAAAEGKS